VRYNKLKYILFIYFPLLHGIDLNKLTVSSPALSTSINLTKDYNNYQPDNAANVPQQNRAILYVMLIPS